MKTATNKMNKEIVYRQGSNWVWSHQTEQGSSTEQLPYHVQSKKDVRSFIQDRYNDRRIDKKFRVSWN